MRGSAHPSLDHVEQFVDRALPTMLRRMRCWKGVHPAQHADVLQDLHQELLLDSLENAEQIAALSAHERHGRWFRLLERRHYQLRLRDTRRIERLESLDDLQDPAAARTPALELLATPEQREAAALQRAASHLKNGRLNTEATAGELGLHPRDVRALWGRLADALGYDEQFLDFWRRRLVEALLGLVGDLLRDRGLVRIHDEARRARPDPQARLHRIRQIKARVGVRPLPPDLKRALARYTPRGSHTSLDPFRAVQTARELMPTLPAVHLWHFETAVAFGRLGEAAAALRRARHHGADTVRTILARARLREAGGHPRRARRMLERALQERRDRRLENALRSLRQGDEEG